MKFFDWNSDKNALLKAQRGIGFEMVVAILEDGTNLLDIVYHYNQKSYPNQKLFIINFQNYAYLVPYVEDEEKIFLKTIIPSRKATQKYLSKNKL